MSFHESIRVVKACSPLYMLDAESKTDCGAHTPDGQCRAPNEDALIFRPHEPAVECVPEGRQEGVSAFLSQQTGAARRCQHVSETGWTSPLPRVLGILSVVLCRRNFVIPDLHDAQHDVWLDLPVIVPYKGVSTGF